MSDHQQGPGWWLASDGKWYPPQGVRQVPVYLQAKPDPMQRMANGAIVGCAVGVFLAMLIVVGTLAYIGSQASP